MVGTRETLITATVAYLDDRGLDGLTLRQIARDAGVSHGAPLRHFTSLSALLSAVAARSFDTMTETIRSYSEQVDDDPLGRLFRAGRGYVGYALANPGSYQLMFRPELLDRTNPEYLRASIAVYDQLATLTALAQATGWRSASPHEHLTGVLWAGVHGIAFAPDPRSTTHGINRDRHVQPARRLSDRPRWPSQQRLTGPTHDDDPLDIHELCGPSHPGPGVTTRTHANARRARVSPRSDANQTSDSQSARSGWGVASGCSSEPDVLDVVGVDRPTSDRSIHHERRSHQGDEQVSEPYGGLALPHVGRNRPRRGSSDVGRRHRTLREHGRFLDLRGPTTNRTGTFAPARPPKPTSAPPRDSKSSVPASPRASCDRAVSTTATHLTAGSPTGPTPTTPSEPDAPPHATSGSTESSDPMTIDRDHSEIEHSDRPRKRTWNTEHGTHRPLAKPTGVMPEGSMVK